MFFGFHCLIDIFRSNYFIKINKIKYITSSLEKFYVIFKWLNEPF